jgi:formylglycine-generating enzyme required for sulfatase activity
MGLAASATIGHAGTVTIETVPVGDVMNIADSGTGYGGVAYLYRIGKFDVTMGQYAAFLNAVATSGDPYGLYSASMATATPTYGITQTSTSAGYVYAAKGNSANVPVTYVNWGSAARFVNWLANNEPTGPEGPGTTETGTYALNGSTGSAALMAVTRSSTASWVLPTVDEWYKAAYYAGGGTNAGYWSYPTQNNSMPSDVLSLSGTNNANFATISGNADPLNLLTHVGFFAASPGAYQTFDMGGNVYEWNETANFASFSTGRYIFGGSFASTANAMFYASAASPRPTGSSQDLGFRVENVPEPNAAAIVFVAIVLLLVWNGVRLTPLWVPSNVKVREAVYGTELL